MAGKILNQFIAMVLVCIITMAGQRIGYKTPLLEMVPGMILITIVSMIALIIKDFFPKWRFPAYAIVAILAPSPYQDPNMQLEVQNSELLFNNTYKKIDIVLPGAGGLTHIDTLECYIDNAIRQLKSMPDITIRHIDYLKNADNRHYKATVYFQEEDDINSYNQPK